MPPRQARRRRTTLFYHDPLFGGVDINETILEAEAGDPSDSENEAAELAFLVARLNRIAADHIRSRRYRRRSNTGGAGFRRNQRRGATS